LKIQPDFQFSASCLQDYVDCSRRFELRYIKKVKWPSLITEPVVEYELRMEMGNRFHEMVYQHQLGLTPEQISAHIVYPELSQWWQNYLQSGLLQSLPALRYAELGLFAPFNAYRIMAKFDLLAIQPDDQMIIVDWKTSSKRTRNTRLKTRLQTILYPYVLVEAGTRFNGQRKVRPGQVSMIYWFTDFPGQPEIFPYDEAEHVKSERILEELVTEIAGLDEGEFPKTASEHFCQFCNYRSLCNRGVQAGDWRSLDEEDVDETEGLEINFDEIGEIKI
jgi:hypothetical protein